MIEHRTFGSYKVAPHRTDVRAGGSQGATVPEVWRLDWILLELYVIYYM